MKTFTLMLAGLGIAASALPMTAATAAPAPHYQAWQNINARQANLYARIRSEEHTSELQSH